MNPDLSGGLDPDPASDQPFVQGARELTPIPGTPVLLKQGESTLSEFRLESGHQLRQRMIGKRAEQVLLWFEQSRPGIEQAVDSVEGKSKRVALGAGAGEEFLVSAETRISWKGRCRVEIAIQS